MQTYQYKIRYSVLGGPVQEKSAQSFNLPLDNSKTHVCPSASLMASVWSYQARLDLASSAQKLLLFKFRVEVRENQCERKRDKAQDYS